MRMQTRFYGPFGTFKANLYETRNKNVILNELHFS